MSERLLSVQDLTLNFGDTRAVDHVSFDIAQGETLALAGPSGSGKSTIARLILRLIQPDSGRILFQDDDFTALRGDTLRNHRRHIQMVFQDSTASFNPRATVQSSIADPLRIFRMVSETKRNEHILSLLDRVGLPHHYLHKPVHELSGGERQRVAIARAIACKPALIVLDEALSAVDASRRLELVSLLIDLQRNENVSYLFISHDLGLIRTLAHRAAILDHGRIVEAGEAAEIIARPQSDAGKRLVAAVPQFPKWND